jgi:hypothetical protein
MQKEVFKLTYFSFSSTFPSTSAGCSFSTFSTFLDLLGVASGFEVSFSVDTRRLDRRGSSSDAPSPISFAFLLGILTLLAEEPSTDAYEVEVVRDRAPKAPWNRCRGATTYPRDFNFSVRLLKVRGTRTRTFYLPLWCPPLGTAFRNGSNNPATQQPRPGQPELLHLLLSSIAITQLLVFHLQKSVLPMLGPCLMQGSWHAYLPILAQ